MLLSSLSISHLLLEYQPAIEAVAVRALFGNLQNEVAFWRSPPDESGPSACSAVAEDLDRLAVESPRRLRPGTFGLLKIPSHAVMLEVVTWPFTSVRYNVTTSPFARGSIRTVTDLGRIVSRKGGSGDVQLPSPKQLSETA